MYARKNISGIRSKLNSVRLEKMFAAFSEWPVKLYTIKLNTLASVGKLIAIALFALRMSSKSLI